MKNVIEKSVDLSAPLTKVWNALIDYQKFGEWFRVKIDQPFVENTKSHGHMTYPGYEQYKWEATINKIIPEKQFSFSWHPYAIDQSKDYTAETPTQVQFILKESNKGTLLTVAETGFLTLPEERQAEAYEMNEHGWEIQMSNIENYLNEQR